MTSPSERIARWCQSCGTVSEEEYPAVLYGLQLILNTVLKGTGILLIGAIAGCVSDVLICMLTFCSMRYMAGGYHARTHIGCFLAMMVPCLLPAVLKEAGISCISLIWTGMLIYSGYEILRYAPRNSIVNPITDCRILKRKRIGSIAGYIVVTAMVCVCQNNYLRWLLIIPLFFEAITISPLLYGLYNRNN